MTWCHVILLGLGHVLLTRAFSWTRQPGSVYACLHGEAVFPWQYDNKSYSSVSNIFWYFLKTGDTVIALERNPDQTWKVVPYHPEIYGDRAYLTKPNEGGAELRIKNVTASDAGRYKIEIGGYSNVHDFADLTVLTAADLAPTLLVDNEDHPFDQAINKTDTDRVSLTISTARSLVADISISSQKKVIATCPRRPICSAVIEFSKLHTPSVEVRFHMNYNICEAHDLLLEVLTGISIKPTEPPSYDVMTTTVGSPEEQFVSKAWFIAIIAVLILILMLLIILAAIWVSYKHKEKKGTTLKPRERRYVECPPINIPMKVLTRWKDTKTKDRDSEKQNSTSSPSEPEEGTPLMERRTPENRLGPGSGNTLFINLARAKGLADDVINMLLEEDFDTEEALCTMEDRDLEAMEIPDEQRQCVKLWLQELMASSSESRDTGITPNHTKTSSTSPSGSSSTEFSIEDCLRNLQLSDKNEREIREHVLKNGVLGLDELLKTKLSIYMKCPVNIAVTGRSGTGKSSVINTLRGLRAKDKGAAQVGVVETTFEMKPYSHPDIDNVLFWDLPGVNTPNFPRISYLQDVEFKRYDAFIIACTERFTQDDMWLAKEASALDTPFYFIRTKIDLDVANNKRDGDGNEKKLLTEIRSQIQKYLSNEGLPSDRVFLVSSILKNKRKWDFPDLVKDLVSKTPERNKFAMVMAMVTCSKEIIMLKKEDLLSRVTTVALAAALSEGNHEEIIKQEVALYADCFGVTDSAMETMDMNKLDSRLRDIKNMLDAIINQPVEESTRGRAVGKYFLGIGYFVGKFIDEAITKTRRAEAAKQTEEITQVTEQVAKDAIVEEAIGSLRTVLDRCEELALAVLEQRQYL